MEDFFDTRSEPPELYADSVRIAMGAYGFAFDFGLGGIADTPESERPPTKRVALLRMSPQHALIFSRLLLRNIAEYEKQVGKINLPPKLFQDLGLDPE